MASEGDKNGKDQKASETGGQKASASASGKTTAGAAGAKSSASNAGQSDTQKAGSAKSTKASGATSGARGPAKKPVTIDLEAKDVTPADAPKTDASAKPAAKPQTVASKTASDAKNETAKPASTKTAANAKTQTAEKAKATTTGTTSAPKGSVPKTAAPPSSQPKTAPSSPPPAVKKSGGFLQSLVAAIVGGIIAILSLFGLQSAGLAPAPVEDLSADLGAVEARLAELEFSPSAGVTPDQLATLESDVTSRIDRIEETVEDTLGGITTDAQSQNDLISDLTSRLAAVEARPAPSGSEETAGQSSGQDTGQNGDEQAQQLAGLIERLTAVETRLATTGNAPTDGDANTAGTVATSELAALNARMETLEDRLATLANAQPDGTATASDADGSTAENDRPVVPDLSDDVAAIQTELASLRKDLNTATSSLTELAAKEPDTAGIIEQAKTALLPNITNSIQAVEASQVMIDERVGSMDDKIAGLSDQTLKLEDSITSLQTTVTDAVGKTESAQTAARSIALANLKGVTTTGGSLAASLAALQSTGVDAQALEPLQPFSEEGLKTKAQLSEDLDRLLAEAAAISTAPAESDEDLSIAEKLAKNAISVINVQRVGDAAVTSNAPLAALRTAFDNNDSAAFSEQLNALADGQKSLLAPWLAEWEAAQALEAVIASVEESLTQPSSQDGEAAAETDSPSQ